MPVEPPVLDREPLSKKRLEGLREDVGVESLAIFDRLLEIFTREAPERIREIHDAIRRKVAFDLLQAAHSLKSSSGNLGVERLRRLAHFFEQRAKEEDLEGLEPWAAKLEEIYQEGRQALEAWVRSL